MANDPAQEARGGAQQVEGQVRKDLNGASFDRWHRYREAITRSRPRDRMCFRNAANSSWAIEIARRCAQEYSPG